MTAMLSALPLTVFALKDATHTLLGKTTLNGAALPIDTEVAAMHCSGKLGPTTAGSKFTLKLMRPPGS